MTAIPSGEPGTLAVVDDWLNRLALGLQHSDTATLETLFTADAYWRDVYGLGESIAYVQGPAAIAAELARMAQSAGATAFRRDDSRPVRDAENLLFLSSDTARGHVKLLVELSPTPDGRGVVATYACTDLFALPETDRDHVDRARSDHNEETWADYRHRITSFEDRDPHVLIVGGGQAGIALGARLARLGVDYLIVERNARAGDNWRHRYEALVLHTPKEMSELPYLPFPDSFPTFLPKNKVADWLEAYVQVMDLNYWTSTELMSAAFDEANDRWRVELRTGDGSVRRFEPQLVVLAIGGVGGRPKVPAIPGLVDFEGNVVHSASFTSAKEHREARALVIGVGTSGHDLALDLARNDCDVTMLQRGEINVVKLDTANAAYPMYFDPSQSLDEADQRFMAGLFSPYPRLLSQMQMYAAWADAEDDSLITELQRAGMTIDRDPEGGGWMMKFLRHGGRYYLEVGCSEAIIKGRISILSEDRFDRLVGNGAQMTDRSVQPFDLVVLATGYQDYSTDIEALFGSDVARSAGPYSGFEADGELAAMCKPTKQKNLWMMSGGIVHARNVSRVLALQLAAHLRAAARA